MKLAGIIAKWVGIGLYAACAVLIVMFLTPVGGWKALDVLTGSMRPAIQPGSLVLIHKVPLASVQPGNIVTYTNPHDPKETITHRVIKVSKVDGITTITVKGDANAIADAPFPGGYVDGRVATIVPGAGHAINWLHNAWTLALIVIIPGLLVIWSEARTLKRALARPNDDRNIPAGGDTPKSQPVPQTVTLSPEPELATHPVQTEQVTPVVAPEIDTAGAEPVGLTEVKATEASKSTEAPTSRPRRRLDSMSRVAMLPLAVITLAVLLVGSATFAAINAKVSLTGNSFQVTPTGSPSPSPSPSPTTSPSPHPTASPCPTNVTISNTGPGSTNIVKCTSKTIIKNSNHNTVNITNSNHQTSNGGSNTNTVNTSVNITSQAQ